jgi:hypothetical protein
VWNELFWLAITASGQDLINYQFLKDSAPFYYLVALEWMDGWMDGSPEKFYTVISVLDISK